QQQKQFALSERLARSNHKMENRGFTSAWQIPTLPFTTMRCFLVKRSDNANCFCCCAVVTQVPNLLPGRFAIGRDIMGTRSRNLREQAFDWLKACCWPSAICG